MSIVQIGNATLHNGDCIEIMRTLPAQSVDSVVCDPPYHLTSIVKRFGAAGAAPAQHGTDGAYARASRGFMGKVWDGGDIAFRPETWAEVLRVLKPGGHLIAFGGTRTFHRMVCAIEDAGFEVRDQLAWIFGSGFPKSHNQHGDWEGWGTALKPAQEPICLARKPPQGTVTSNVLRHGTGALNVDACRIGTEGGGQNGTNGDRDIAAWRFKAVPKAETPVGRWPANVIHDGSHEVEAAFAAFGEKVSNPGTYQKLGAAGCYSPTRPAGAVTSAGDAGSASRFFYSAKATAEDRVGSKHPTVKPQALMRHLCRLVTQQGGVVLDPFAGSGSTGQAAVAEGFRAILIERETEYFADCCNRLTEAQRQRDIFHDAPVSDVTPPGTAAYDRDLRDLFAETLA